MRLKFQYILWGLLIWLIGAGIGSWLTLEAWVYGSDGLVKLAGNYSFMVTLPGWVAVHVLPIGMPKSNPLSIVLANFIGIGFLGAGVVCFLMGIKRIVRLRARAESATDSVSLDRRRFLGNASLGTLAVSAASVPGYATLVEPWSIQVRRYEPKISGLPESLRGLRIVQVADTHLGPRVPGSFIEQAYQMAIDLKPDLIVLTGDHVHDGTRENQRAAELCRPLVEAAPMGVIGVLGNHDWWGDGTELSRLLSEQGVRMIDNDRVWIDSATKQVVNQKPSGESLSIVGIGDLTDGGVDLGRAFRDSESDIACIVLAHNPDTAELRGLSSEDSPRVDLMISGHTHGGQVKIPFLGTPIVPSRYGQKYAGGLVQGPRFPVLVSRGIGMSALPVRVGVPPEISLIELA